MFIVLKVCHISDTLSVFNGFTPELFVDICGMEVTTPQFKIGLTVSNDAMSGGEKVCELYFTDAIYNKVNYWTGEEQSMLADIIKQVNEAKPTKIIQYIDSWGGSCDVGLGVYNYLKGHTAKVESRILNSCASIATVISAAGNKGKISMPRNGFMVIHQAQTSASGTADDLREEAMIADKYTNTILDIYAQTNRKGKTRDELYDCIKDGDYWMTGQEALDMGFVDSLYNNDLVTVTNSIAKAKEIYNNIPQRILAMADATQVTNDVESSNIFKTLFNNLKMEIATIVADFKALLPKNAIGGTGEPVDFTALLDAPITNLLISVDAAIKAEIGTASTNAMTSVTDAVGKIENKYKEVLDALTTKVDTLTASVGTLTNTINEQATEVTTLKETNAAQAKTITAITADMEEAAGKGATPASERGAATAAIGGKTFAGRTKPIGI